MRRTAIAGIILIAAVTAMGGENPDVRLYVDFDPPNYVHGIEPELYTSYDAYICVDCLGTEQSEGGIEEIYFRVDVTGSIYSLVSFSPLVTAHIPITWPEIDGDIFLWMVDCLTDDPCPLVAVHLFCLGGSGCILINDHNELPRWVYDCNLELDYYCVYSHGSVAGGECPPGDPGCDCSGGTAVQSSTWGSMKALYR